MRHLTRILRAACATCATCATAAVVSMTACSAPETASTNGSQRAVFPVTITRTGGVAGFQDVLVVSRDGLVSVTRKGRAQRTCRLNPVEASRVAAAASQVPWTRITETSTHPSFPDELVTTMTSPAGGPARLQDRQVGPAGKVFLELLQDVVDSPAASRRCVPL